MAVINPLPSRGFLIVLVAGVLGCAAGDLTLPDPAGGDESVELSKFPDDNGDNQEATVGEALPKPLVVQVLTAAAQPAMGRSVEFIVTSPADAVAPETAITNSQGIATFQPVLGTSPGHYLIQARLISRDEEPQTEEFTVAAKPAPPETLNPVSPTSQSGRLGQEVSDPPAVQVFDRYGNPVPDVAVAWHVIAGEGQAEPLTRTASDGTTSVKWALGTRVGVHKLTASIEATTGSPTIFTAWVFF
jgi:hypothetical protein